MGKNIFLSILAAGLFISGCTKNISTAPVNDRPVDTASATLLYRGNFINGPYGRTSGQANVYNEGGKWILRLEGFMVSNGPDLKVYLSKEQQPLNFIRLGNLRSTSGNQSYDISGMPDITTYRYALIHCEQYNHLFGSAVLIMQ